MACRKRKFFVQNPQQRRERQGTPEREEDFTHPMSFWTFLHDPDMLVHSRTSKDTGSRSRFPHFSDLCCTSLSPNMTNILPSFLTSSCALEGSQYFAAGQWQTFRCPRKQGRACRLLDFGQQLDVRLCQRLGAIPKQPGRFGKFWQSMPKGPHF